MAERRQRAAKSSVAELTILAWPHKVELDTPFASLAYQNRNKHPLNGVSTKTCAQCGALINP